MADRGGPEGGGVGSGHQQWQGGGRPPRRRTYNYGVPSDDDYDDADERGPYDAYGQAGSHGQYGDDGQYGSNGQYGANGQYDAYGQNGHQVQDGSPASYGGQYGQFGAYEQYGQPSQPTEYNQYGQPSQYGQQGGNGQQFGQYQGQSQGPYQGPGQPGPYVQQGHANGYGAPSPGGQDYYGGYDYSEPYDYTGQPAGPPGGGNGAMDGYGGYGYQQGADPRMSGGPNETVQLRSPGTQAPGAAAGTEVPDPFAPAESAATSGASVSTEADEAGGGGSADTATSRGRTGTSNRGTGGRAERRRAAKRVKRRRRLSATKEIPILIGVALVIAVVLKTFLVQAFVIPSGSMEQTIRIGDRVLVDKLTPWFGAKPERGDVVVFKDPGGWLDAHETQKEDSAFGVKQGKELLTTIGLLPSNDEQDLIKRTVGVGGDHVHCCDDEGRVTVNGTPLKEPYLHPGNKPSKFRFDVRVPAGRIFVMGDHRANSADSRYHMDNKGHGTVSEDSVVGRAIVIAWPFDHWRKLEEPATYASVHKGSDSRAAAPGPGVNPLVELPTPAELPLVMGVVGLSRRRGRRQWRVRRDGAGGRGGRRSLWARRRGRRWWRRRGLGARDS